LSKEALNKALYAFETVDSVFGFLKKVEKAEDIAPRVIDILVDIREELRKKKEFALSDSIRQRLATIGVLIEDSPRKVKWRFA